MLSHRISRIARIAGFLAILALSAPSASARLRLEGTAILPESNVYGQITDISTGKGIAGVPVTDGYTFTVTDRRGVYQMRTDTLCRKVYYTLPSGYRTAVGEDGYPRFFNEGWVDPGVQTRCDFSLEPLDSPEENFTLVMVSDPQCKYPWHLDRFASETVPDIRATLDSNPERYPNPYAFTLGDLTEDSNDMWDAVRASMAGIALKGGNLPFYQCIGNHDHDSMVHTSDYDATRRFTELFGPTDYSLNRGDVHIVVMDDIMVTKIKEAPKTSNKYSWKYEGGFTDAQLEWLRQDLALVRDKHDKMIVLCLHIPFRNGVKKGGQDVNLGKHYDDVLRLLTDFHQAHIMIGHTHYSDARVHSDYLTRSGLPVYEHVHGASCGAWWRCNSNVNGGPNGYGIYEVEGNSMKNWVYKGTAESPSFQMRVYDGNQVYTGSKGYEYRWYEPENVPLNPVGKKPSVAKGYPALEGCLIADVWNDDDTYWTVELFKDGEKVCDMERVPIETCSHMPMCNLFFNELGRTKPYFSLNICSHLWYWKPPCEPSDYTGWEVVATQRIPGSDVVNVYRCSELTTDPTSVL